MARVCTNALTGSLPHIEIGECQCTRDAGRFTYGPQVTRELPDIDGGFSQWSVLVDDGVVARAIK